MAGAVRPAAPAVSRMEQLEREPWAFDFYRAMRLLECSFSDRPRLGQAFRASDEPVRLGQEPSMAFAPSTLSEYRRGLQGEPDRMAVLFFGLFGPNGPLPLHLTEYARDRIRNSDDPTFARFVDVFHHRLLSLFYRAWANGRPEVWFDRADGDRFSVYCGSLLGLGTPGVRGRDAMPDVAKQHYAGHLGRATRTAEGLESILADYFKRSVRLESFVGQWVMLPEQSRWKLGHSPETGALGQSIAVGRRIWDCQQKFRIVVGPLDLESYRGLLPGGRELPQLVAVVRNYVGDELEWDVRLILRRDEVPGMRLGHRGRLGWSTWIQSGQAGRDADELVLNPLSKEAGR
ncbi:type VI secretion protein [Acidobacteria bacterium Mor1]|nr:type VI secretion protein [Acidobacteria bacterium Mor1]